MGDDGKLAQTMQQFMEKRKELKFNDIYNEYREEDWNEEKLFEKLNEEQQELVKEYHEKLEKIRRPGRIKQNEEWEFENILPEDHFISQYLDLGTGLTDAYPEYHFSTALSLLSMSADRKVKIKITPQSMYTNFWTLLIGYSTVSRKSTALDIGRTILNLAELEHKLLPQDFSPEALIEQLEEYPKSYFLRDEFGDFLAKMSRSYQAGIDALLSRLYDCPGHYKRKLRKEEFEIKDTYITLTGACVPKQIARHSSVEDLESGFFPRIAFLWPERKKERMDIRTPTKEETEKQKMLGMWLSDLYDTINMLYHKNDESEIDVKLTDEALDYYNKWCENFEKFIIETEKGKEFSAFFGRMSDAVLKIAALLKLGSGDMRRLINAINGINTINNINKINDRNTSYYVNSVKSVNLLKLLIPLIVDLPAIKIAIFYAVKLYLPNSRKVMKYVKSYQDEDKLEKVHEIAVKYSGEDNKISHSDLLRRTHMKAKDFNEYVSTLLKANRLDLEFIEDTKHYIPIEPDEEKRFPDVNRPSLGDLSLDLPEEIEIKQREVEEEAGKKEALSFNRIKDKIKELAEKKDGANDADIKEELGINDEQFENLKEKLLEKGDFYEPKPNQIKSL